MTDRSGCGLAELTVLQVVDERSEAPGRAVVSAEVLAEVDRRIGLGPSYAYAMMCDLVTPWVIPVPLLAVHGSSFGDRIFRYRTPASHARCRLSRAGELVVAAEAGAVAPVPAGLINGSWWRGAAQPPLDPFRVIAALRRLIEDPGLPEGQLLQIAGRPVSLTGSELAGDFDALAQGRRTTIRELPRITRTDAAARLAQADSPRKPDGSPIRTAETERPNRPVHLIVDAVPSHLSAPELLDAIASRIRPEGWQPPEPPGLRLGPEIRAQMAAGALPIADLRDESREADVRLAITLRSGADPQAVQAQLGRLEELGVDRAAEFPAPLVDLLRSWVATHRDQDITASLSRFEAAARANRLDQDALEMTLGHLRP